MIFFRCFVTEMISVCVCVCNRSRARWNGSDSNERVW